ncbi:hypothetical protein G6F68_018776 [Rhizopus microsporus]|nr:hypothetical protein G6F68_018776 [Rhizopus microsporus]
MDRQPGRHRSKRRRGRADRPVRDPHRAQPFHRVPGLHGDRARLVAGHPAGHAAVAVLATGAVQVRRPGRHRGHPRRHPDLRRHCHRQRLRLAPGGAAAQGVLHRQQ